jgi:thymidylate synthase
LNTPLFIIGDSFQAAWAKAIIALSNNHWKAWSVVVHIQDPSLLDQDKHEEMRQFALDHKGVIEPNKVAYTIFPYKLYRFGITKERLYKGYWKYFKLTRRMAHRGWGTYFERMIKYQTPNGNVDQLGRIINNINNHKVNYGAAHVIIIPQPHRDINKIMGAPCLNYITVQVEKADQSTGRKTISLLAVYRNHDFRARAYGNYLGLCKLLQYVAAETNSNIGKITCISSHAEVLKNDKRTLLEIANSFLVTEERNA